MERKIKVLIVDDEVLVRIGIIHAFAWEKNGFEIIGEAADGEGCLEMARSYHPDLIVLDINMPGMDGLEVLRRLKEEGYQGKVIMLTCYDEFEYVREAMRGGASDYVLKSNLRESGLPDAVLNLDYEEGKQPEGEKTDGRKMRSEKYLRQKIDGYFLGDAGELGFCPLRFCAVAGRIREMEKLESRYAQKGMDLFYRSFYSLLEQALSSCREYDIIQYDRETVGIFLSFSDTASTQEAWMRIRRLLPHMHGIIRNYLDLDVIFGVSCFCCGEEEIAKAWEEACTMLDRRFFEKREIFYYDDVKDNYQNKEELLAKLWDKEAQIREQVVDNRLDEVREGMQAWCEQVRRGKVADSEHIRDFCQDLIKLIQAQEKNWKDSKIWKEIREQETLEETESLVYNYLEHVIPEGTDQNTNWQVRRACDYIREHYRKDLNLGSIAQYLGLSESYTSRIFNKYMGMNIPAYINQVRIEQAKGLLRETNKKIYEIAFETGYISTTAFHIAFKKQEGITPIEFRNQ